ncbi:MAG TPA: hypothetical protein PKK10_04465 [Woeseiaceae bacterium]|nr:hypothetical protein [Woeseiaceae bacterium]
MHEGLKKAVQITVTVLAVASFVGCAPTSSWLDRVTPGKSTRSAEPVSPGAPNADDYLRELDMLATGDPATQAEIFADAKSRATLTPGPSTNLRYALVLATPGHSGTDLQQSQSLLREVLTQTTLMTPSEIALAHIYLGSVEQQLVVASEVWRLRESSSTSRQDRTEEQAVSQRLAGVEAENRQLRNQLAEAEEKLEAITNIERSIREQGQ